MTEQPPNTPPRILKISTTTIIEDESVTGLELDGGLWDGESQIRFEDVYATAKKSAA